MTDAINTPLRRRGPEQNSADHKIEQRDPVSLLADAIDHDNTIVASPPISKDYQEMLAFMEEPVEIIINKGPEKHAALTVDCWVNGKGSEVFNPNTKQWMNLGWIPVGKAVVVKRKYVEVLLRSKVDNVSTDVGNPGQEDEPRNNVLFNTSARANVVVVQDRSPHGSEWVSRLMREQG